VRRGGKQGVVLTPSRSCRERLPDESLWPLGGSIANRSEKEENPMANKIARPQQVQQADQNQCRHRWLIQTPNGAKAPGRCKNCGIKRSFPTAPDRMSWGEARFTHLSALS
jgi:hypothetical protein